MPEIFKERIIKLLKHADYKPQKLAQLAKALGVNSDYYPQFKTAFDQLREAGHVVMGAGHLIALPAMSGVITGTFRANPKGFGFVMPLEPGSHADLFIPPDATSGAMTGDIVAARITRKTTRDGQMRYSGRITEVLERAENRFVGTLLKQPQGWIVQPDGSAFFEPIRVDDVTAKGAKQKDKVVVEILSYPTEQQPARGVIVEVIGKAGQYESEIRSIIHQYHLPGEFDSDCLEQARKAAAEFDAGQSDGREDITEKVIITIDPPDAKDFDDAISLEKDARGNFMLGVHIADVSRFVSAGSPLDTAAAERGNSVYLPGRVLPMLPEILSNGICSLQPGQKRFVKSVYLTYDRQGKILSRRYANSIICSTQRLTYQQADKILKGHKKDARPGVVELLKNMETLSRIIEKRRIQNGMIHLDMPETELVMDKSGRVVDAHPADDSYPHTIIEMFMVEANDAVASLLDRIRAAFIRRIHPEPDELSMKNLSQFLRALGFSMPRNPDRAAIQQLLNSVRDTDYAPAVNLVVLRSLEKARYAPLDIGHYALASTHYCHFTSPIRRYADLLIHRGLQLYLENHASKARLHSAGQNLAEVGKHISFTEQRAEDAEKELTNVLILQMLSKKIGDELDGIVTGVTNFGVFVQSRKFGIEGLIRIGDLGQDKWSFSAKAQSIVGQHSGHTIRLGQAMKVRIESVNVPARQLNVSPAEPPADSARKEKKKKSSKNFKRSKTKSRSKGKKQNLN